MGKPTGFKEYARENLSYAPVADRITHYNEFSQLPVDMSRQGARCMDCGIPFCHNGCPINNIIPDWNDLVYHGKWKEALDVLHSTNNFPEFTGRICPAPCEEACTVNLIGDAISIKNIELSIVEKGWEEDWIVPLPPEHKSGKKVAIVGSGPSGLACAQQLARAGHDVVVYEKANRVGGLMRYGIPNFKFEKHIIDRRIGQMRGEGVDFRINTHIGVDVSAKDLLDEYDAVVLAGGSEKPRDLPIEGRDELSGIHFAMELLTKNTQRVLGDEVSENEFVSASGKHVVVIGGGDTGSDCIGTSNRHGAESVTQLEILPAPPEKPNKLTTWPYWPMKMRTSTSQEEGCERDFAVTTKRFVGENGKVTAIECARVDWKQDDNGQWQMSEIPGSEFTLKADLVLLAMGFVHPVHEGMIEELGVDQDGRGNVAANTDDYRTSLDKVFAAGDMRRGQSLVVWAIREGRQAARAVDEYLMGSSDLPR